MLLRPLSLSLLALSFALAGGPLRAEQTAAPAAANPPPAISVVTVGQRQLTDRVLVSGLVSPVETVFVAPLVEGQQIEDLLADVGDSVAQGQVLARLSQASLTLQQAQLVASVAASRAAVSQAGASLTDAQSAAAEAQRQADRTAKLAAAGTASPAANDQAQAGLVSAQARLAVATQTLEATRSQLALAEAQLDNVNLMLTRTEVVAPVAGIVTARDAQLGAIASAAGQPMFTLMRDGAMELRADVAEADLARLAPGQPAELRLSASGLGLTGALRLVEPTIDAQSRLGHVRVAIDDATAVRAGMFAEATIVVAQRQTLAVPLTSVSVSSGRSIVMLARGGVVEGRLVTTGLRDGQWVEILDGLAAGDQIVARAGAFVRDGDRINPVPLATN